jgi:hypothetical protein
MNKPLAPELDEYPWYAARAWNDLQQGDLLWDCPVLEPTKELTEILINATDDIESPSPVGVITHDLIIMSQSCDLAADKIDQVLMCAIFDAPAGKDNRTDIKKEKRPALHMIEECELEGFGFGQKVVDFRTIYTLPKDFVKAFTNRMGERVRLLPPYREHLAQAFARYFMRVGLPRPLK